MQILLIDDHTLFRDGLKFLLRDLNEQLEFMEADTVAGALALPQLDSVSIVLLDLELPDTSQLDGLRAVRRAMDNAMVVVLSSHDEPAIIRAAIAEGASGYIPKSSTRDVLIAALKLVLAGGTYLPPNLLDNAGPEDVADAFPGPPVSPLNNLSERQHEVLMSAVQGKVNKVIARELDITEATVKAHLSASFRALGVKNRTEAVYAVARTGPRLSSGPAQ